MNLIMSGENVGSSFVAENQQLKVEIERLRKMVKDAYNIGFAEGMKEVTSSRGGIPWNDSKYRRMLEGVK